MSGPILQKPGDFVSDLVTHYRGSSETSSFSTEITPKSSSFGDWNRLCNVRISKVVQGEFVFSLRPLVIRFLRLTFAAVLSSLILNHIRLFPLVVVTHYGASDDSGGSFDGLPTVIQPQSPTMPVSQIMSAENRSMEKVMSLLVLHPSNVTSIYLANSPVDGHVYHYESKRYIHPSSGVLAA